MLAPEAVDFDTEVGRAADTGIVVAVADTVHVEVVGEFAGRVDCTGSGESDRTAPGLDTDSYIRQEKTLPFVQVQAWTPCGE